VTRARAAFSGAWLRTRPDRGPLILLAERGEHEGSDEPYVGWLESAGARVRRLRSELVERDLATADALVLAGSVIDLHPALYRERPRAALNRPDLRRDLAETTRPSPASAGVSFPLPPLPTGWSRAPS